MALRIGLWTTIALLWTTGGALAQPGPWRGGPNDRPPAGPDQPIRPQVPALQRRAPPPQAPRAPFDLSPKEELEVGRMLQLWEQTSAGVKTFECKFKRWIYDPVFGPADKAAFEDLGIIKYAAPDKGLIRIDGDRQEQWICDGKSVFEYKYKDKQVIEHKLPPELQGQAIANSPLPFIFGTKADHLKQRYFIRVITPREVQGQQTWLEVFPRFQQDAANFQRIKLILSNQNMTPAALELYEPNGKNHISYAFYDVVINDPLRIFKGDPFAGRTPLGWQKVVDEPAAAQTGRVPPPAKRR
jgi:TIGR03009 family protein